jgi:hypothetical protein
MHRTIPVNAEKASPANPTEVFQVAAPESMALPQFEMAGVPNDLDLPTFMRRRNR